jgi:hypothetical protein
MPLATRTNAARWQDGINLILGCWLFISPWVLGFVGLEGPAWNAWIFGAVVALVSLAALSRFAAWEEWLNVALGAWLLMSPWVLGFAASRPLMWNFVAVGAAVAALALWELQQNREQPRAAL